MKRWAVFIGFVCLLAGWRATNNRIFKTYSDTSRDIANRHR